MPEIVYVVVDMFGMDEDELVFVLCSDKGRSPPFRVKNKRWSDVEKGDEVGLYGDAIQKWTGRSLDDVKTVVSRVISGLLE